MRYAKLGFSAVFVLGLGSILFFGSGQRADAKNKPPSGKVLKKAWVIIQEALTSSDSKIREQAVQALEFVDNKYSVNSLISSLEDESDYVKIWAARSLARKGSSAGKDALLSILLSDAGNSVPKTGSLAALAKLQALARGRVRGEAAKVLGLINDPELKPILKRAKRDTDGRVRDGAAVALALMGDTTETIVFASALKSQDKAIRLAAAEALEAIGDPNTAPQMLMILNDSEEAIRNVAAKGLGRAKSREAIESLASRLTDPSGLVRESSAWALGEIAEPKKIPYVKASLSDPNVYVKLAAAAALGKMNDGTGLATCEEALNSNDVDSRVLGAKTLGFINTKLSQSLATKYLKDGHQKVRLGAAASLFRMAYK